MIRIVEVGPRDGLQNEKKILETQDKFLFISKLIEAGLKNIEVTSFVRAPAIPQMADSSQLYQKVHQVYGDEHLSFPCLVPNLKGFETAKEIGVKEIAVFTATSDTFSLKNTNATVEKSLNRLSEVCDEAQKNNIRIRGYVSTAFGCPYEGAVQREKLIEVTQKLFNLGVYEVSIGDTIGVATPSQVKSTLKALKEHFQVEKLAMHFHDTRGMALTNVYASLEEGIQAFDSSAGGLGGCPYAKGASGNLATEDLCYLLHSEGLETGVDVEKLSQASEYILQKLEKTTESKFLKAYLSTKTSC